MRDKPGYRVMRRNLFPDAPESPLVLVLPVLQLVLATAVGALLCGTAVMIAQEVWSQEVANVVAVISVIVFLALLVWLGWFLLRDPSARRRGADHAFVITDDTLEFPAGNGRRRAESWPLTQTQAEVRSGRFTELQLRCKGYKSRNYWEASLEERPAEILTRIEAAQHALRGRR